MRIAAFMDRGNIALTINKTCYRRFFPIRNKFGAVLLIILNEFQQMPLSRGLSTRDFFKLKIV